MHVMIKRYFLSAAGCLAILIIAGLLWIYVDRGKDVEAEIVPMGTAAAVKYAAPAATEEAVDSGNIAIAHQGVRTNLDARTRGEFEAQVERAGFSSGERLYFGLQAAIYCQTHAVPDKFVMATQSGRAAAAHAKTFCDGREEGERNFYGLEALPPNDNMRKVLSSREVLLDLAGQGKAEDQAVIGDALSLLEVSLAEKGTPQSLVAAESLQAVGHVPKEVVALARKNGWALSENELAQAQVLSAQMQLCGQVGGCGRGGPLTMMFCASAGTCSTTANAQDALRASVSPKVFDAAVELSRLR